MLSGVPSYVQPSDEKIDVKRLKNDIPKFFTSSCFEECHKKWWDDFLNDQDGVFARAEAASTWLLDDIMIIKERQHGQVEPQPKEIDETPNVLQIARPSNARPEMEKLVVDQFTDEIPQVTFN